MKRINIILLFSFVFQFAFSQKILVDLKKYDYKKAENILKDSLFMQETVGRHCQFHDNKEKVKENIRFTIIPVCKFKDTITYIPNSSIINYIELDTFHIISLIFKKDILLGELSGYLSNRINEEVREDISGNTLINPLNEIKYGKEYKWVYSNQNVCNLCSDKSIFKIRLHNFLKKEKPELFFMFPPNNMIIWFIRNNKLMAYNLLESKEYKEKEFIEGIGKKEFPEGEKVIGAVKHSTIRNIDIYYFLEYK